MHAHHLLDTPPREACVLRYMLEARTKEVPDGIFVVFHEGETWTYAETLQRVQQRAGTLRAQGVQQGDRVLCWLGNGPDLLINWFAINYLGAVYAPLNTALRGRPLEHVVNNAQAEIMLAHPSLCNRLDAIASSTLKTVLVMGGSHEYQGPAHSSLNYLSLHDVPSVTPDDLALSAPIEPWDTQAIMYTSGTTGMPKGVISSYTQLYTMGPDAFTCLNAHDRCMIAGPIFHCGSTLYVYAMLACGGSIAMIPEFRTGEFWDAIRATQSTVVLLLGVMASFLLKQTPSDRDRDHPLKKAFIVPFGEEAPLFKERYGVDLYTVYNMTEIASPLTTGPDISETGLCGQARPWFELRVADTHDQARPNGEVGELLIRSHRPWALFSGYHQDPQATMQAMRNGWFHTGDAFRRDDAGNFYFVDRLKDVIRRRGENISSFELEGELCSHPGIREAVAVAVPSEHSEDEVLAVITPMEGIVLDPTELIHYLSERVPHYMIPRYVRTVSELPKTASGKLQKHVLRSEGLTDDTWDRDAAGIRLKRERLD